MGTGSSGRAAQFLGGPLLSMKHHSGVFGGQDESYSPFDMALCGWTIVGEVLMLVIQWIVLEWGKG